MILQACATGVRLVAPGQPVQQLPPGSPLLPVGNPMFRAAPFDILEVDVYPAHNRGAKLDYGSQVHVEADFAGGAYAVSPGDTLSIEIGADTDDVSEVVVRPDGYITLAHLSKEVRAAGRSAADLGTVIADEYSAIMRFPKVTVAIVRSSTDMLAKISGLYQVGLDGKIIIPVLGSFPAVGLTTGALSDQIAVAAKDRFRTPVRISASFAQLTGRDLDPRIELDGRSYFRGTTKVSPDGEIFLQPGGRLRVAGLTVAEVRKAALAQMQPLYSNDIDINVGIAESPALSVFVGGEVRQPGRYPYVRSMTLLKVIIVAGWISDVGDLDRVLLLHQETLSHYLVYRSNLQEVLDHAAVDQDLAVGPQDIVVIPKTTIGDLDQFVDQYIRKLIPINAAASYSYISNPVGNTVTTSPAARATQ